MQQDSVLVADCLNGTRDAFRLLVEHYQSLIAALIYSRCSNLAQTSSLFFGLKTTGIPG